MKPRKPLFRPFAIWCFCFCIGFAATCTFFQTGVLQESFLRPKIRWIILAGGFFILMVFGRVLLLRNGIERKITCREQMKKAAEILPAGLMILTGLILRMLVIRFLPMQPQSDFRIYYNLADMLSRGTLFASEEGIGYCEYVSEFPHVLGYPAVLSLAFRVFGTEVYTAQILNLLFQMLSCVLVWRTARLLGGRLSGLFALALTAFLPSVILYSNILGSEALFTCLLMTGIWLFAHLMQPGGSADTHPWRYLAGWITLGFVLAFSSFVRPMGIIFLISAVICMVTVGREKPEVPEPKKPVRARLTDRWWKQCLILTAVYFLGTSMFSLYTARTIRREPAGASASFGYNLLVGLNQQSTGVWNQEDADYLQSAMGMSGTATAAQAASRDLALERLKFVKGFPRLLADKFIFLWGTDDFGASWNLAFLGEQGELTPERNAFLKKMVDVSDMYYLFLLLSALFCGRIMRRRTPDAGYALILMICGTVALHLLVEQQNRYHYHALFLLAVLGGIGLSTAVRTSGDRFMKWFDCQRRK